MNYKQHVAEMKKLAETQLEEMKRINDALARIEQILRQHRDSGRTSERE